jgi:hypothetical protein
VTPEPRVFHGFDRPLVQVEVDGTWYPGELRMWEQRDGVWWGQVTYSLAAGQTHLDAFPESRIRRVAG